MIKQGDISERTPDSEERVKRASTVGEAQPALPKKLETLDDDVTKRLADHGAKTLKAK
jgi:hypothetical protein